VVSQEEANAYLRDVKRVLIELIQQQEAIYTENPGHVFIEGLQQAFKDGKAHLIDSQTGQQPKTVAPSKVGWRNNEANGLWVGWRDPKTGGVFIRSDVAVEALINLLPKSDREHFSTGGKKFWKELKNQDWLKCDPNSDRNTTRIRLKGAKADNNYLLNWTIKSKTQKGG